MCHLHRLITYASEHNFSVLIGEIHQFIVLDFTNLLHKLERLWISVTHGKLKDGIDNSCIYGGNMGHHKEIKFLDIEKIPVGVNYGPKICLLMQLVPSVKLLI